MDLYLLRHGRAGAPGPGGDAARGLTAEGRAGAARAASALLALGARPAAVASSPLARAMQTAEIAAGILGAGPPEAWDELRPGGAPGPLLGRASRLGAGPALLVGHEPQLSSLAAGPGAAPGAVRLKKAGLARLKALPAGPGGPRHVLAWLLTPALERALLRGAPARPE